jgi:hypothetical protein
MQVDGTGRRVRFGASLGLIEHPNATLFEHERVYAGEEGEYVGPHPSPDLAAKHWHLVKIVIDGREMFAPCHESQFDVIA